MEATAWSFVFPGRKSFFSYHKRNYENNFAEERSLNIPTNDFLQDEWKITYFNCEERYQPQESFAN